MTALPSPNSYIHPLPPLASCPDLHQYALAVFGGKRPRKQLFEIVAFRKEFKALTPEQQDALWAQFIRPHVPAATLDTWFNELCAGPCIFEWRTRYWSGATSCPRMWLRREMALRFEAALRDPTTLVPKHYIYSREFSEPPNLKTSNTLGRSRLGYKSPNWHWISAMKEALIAALDAETYAQWLEDPELSMVMAHEIGAANGTLPATPTGRRMVHHRLAREALDARERAQYPTRFKRRLYVQHSIPGTRDATQAYAARRAAEAEATATADRALVLAGGTLKDLGKAIKARMPDGHMPRPESVVLYAKSLGLLEHDPLLLQIAQNLP